MVIFESHTASLSIPRATTIWSDHRRITAVLRGALRTFEALRRSRGEKETTAINGLRAGTAMLSAHTNDRPIAIDPIVSSLDRLPPTLLRCFVSTHRTS